MSKKAHSNLRFLATDHVLDEGGAHELHERDQTGRPKLGLAGVSDPRRSELVEVLMAVIESRLSWATYSSPIPAKDGDVVNIFESAGLNRREAKAWELRCSGFTIDSIRIFIGVERGNALEEDRLTRHTVEEYLRRGRIKLRRWYAKGAA